MATFQSTSPAGSCPRDGAILLERIREGDSRRTDKGESGRGPGVYRDAETGDNVG